eukprot:CAMPEP_0172440388 /NCGR_PEP_ID=MMETSP1065-20121228/1016_1 /TAXON_ID=265537 /ORGANISM="Amphiprora paludosa, Strain CCMP125" /LENGTH=40 /DNA_ID= /DNA_START= /DNA_END= /DNA_ORIENTATION=
MTWSDWVLTLGLSVPAMALVFWISLVRREMKESEDKKKME